MLSKHSNKLFLGCARLLLGGRLAVPHWPGLYTQFFWNSHCDAAVVCHRGLTRVGEFPDSCKLGLGTNSGPGKILKLRGYVSFFPNWWARSGRARFRLARLDLDFAMRWSHLMVWVREFYRARVIHLLPPLLDALYYGLYMPLHVKILQFHYLFIFKF